MECGTEHNIKNRHIHTVHIYTYRYVLHCIIPIKHLNTSILSWHKKTQYIKKLNDPKDNNIYQNIPSAAKMQNSKGSKYPKK
uniref:Uncharacterized protein n=1 Tax=Anguilla anguilla TaxID=7936 RepID=A0A0E9T3G9_ANGAN